MRGVDARRSCAVEGSHELIIHFSAGNTCTGNTRITKNKPRTEGERHGKDGTTETHKHRTVPVPVSRLPPVSFYR